MPAEHMGAYGALDLWNKVCIADWIPGDELIEYLLFAPESEFASIDAIVFLEPNTSVGFGEWPVWTLDSSHRNSFGRPLGKRDSG
jgi:hypothetical protein